MAKNELMDNVKKDDYQRYLFKVKKEIDILRKQNDIRFDMGLRKRIGIAERTVSDLRYLMDLKKNGMDDGGFMASIVKFRAFSNMAKLDLDF